MLRTKPSLKLKLADRSDCAPDIAVAPGGNVRYGSRIDSEIIGIGERFHEKSHLTTRGRREHDYVRRRRLRQPTFECSDFLKRARGGSYNTRASHCPARDDAADLFERGRASAKIAQFLYRDHISATEPVWDRLAGATSNRFSAPPPTPLRRSIVRD